MSKQSISQPSHDSIRLSGGLAHVVTEPAPVGEAPRTVVHIEAQALDANDAVRLAAFLNRFYTEQNQTAQRTQAQAERRAAAARAVK